MIGFKEKHRPAYISYKNNIREVKYSINGIPHRPPPRSSLSYKKRKTLGDYGGPANIIIYHGRKIISYYSYGKLHRPPVLSANNQIEHLPAYVEYYENKDIVKIEKYYVNGLLHRDNTYGSKPSLITYFKDGRPKKIEYRFNGILNRPIKEGPANIFYYGRGTSIRL